MYLTDYHTHSCCSPDSTARLEDMVRAARRAGLRELCTTDHCDLQDENGAPLGGWDWTPILDQDWRARDTGGSEVKVLLGLELGGAYTDPGRAEALVAAAPLDFVIGSIHNLVEIFSIWTTAPRRRATPRWMTISPVCWL